MYLGAIYTRVFERLCGAVIIMAGLTRVSTNYLYGLHYQDANPTFWQDLYYQGLCWFELLVLMGVAGLAKRNLPDRIFLIVSYFTDLAVYAWIKEFFLNPMEWQVFEEAGFLFSLILLTLRLVISRRRRIKILNLIKLILK